MPKKAKGKRSTAAGATTVRGKNANGDGSIYLDARGRYRATYVDRATGRRRTATGATKAQARDHRDAKLAELATTGTLGAGATVADVARHWLTHKAPAKARPPTLHAYGKDVARIIDRIGAMPVADLDTAAVESFLAALRAAGYGIGTIRNTRARLRQVADCAVSAGHLRGNPVAGVALPMEQAEDRRARRSLTAGEVHRLLGACDDARLGAAVAILFTSGLRASEVLGLAWDDIDLAAGTARVRRAVTYSGGGVGLRIDRPKTAATGGVHHLAPTAVRLLERRRAAQAADKLAAGALWADATYEGDRLRLVFTTATGGPVLRQTLYKATADLAASADVDTAGVGTHTGRRTVVTALYQSGFSLDDVARHVGHASTATTAGYVTDLGTRPREVAARAASLLDPSPGRSS